jgi:polyisoprenyl-teichoic acid--peptidoglycan teichoic acid transferase
MDFKSRPPRKTSVDGFVSQSRRQPFADSRPSNHSGFTPTQRRSTVGFDNDSRHAAAPAAKGTPMQQAPQKQSSVFSNYYSSYGSGSQAGQARAGSKNGKPKKHRRWKKIAFRSGLGVLVVGVIIGGWLGFKVIGNLDKVLHGNIFSDAGALVSSTTLKGEVQGRVNVLLLGDSADRTDAAANGGELTDSMMVVSIDTKNQTAFMLSIPRDLWVNVPNEGWAKINSTYETDGFSGVEQLVDEDLGIPIDYYALVNYQAFEGLVDAVGGITVNIQSPDPRGLYDPQPFPGAAAFKLPNGEDTLNGLQALDLARARGEGYGSYGFPNSDFTRTQHQRQMLVAIAQKAESIGVVSNPIKVSQIFDTLGNNVQTNLTLADSLQLIKLTKGIKLSAIQSLAYSNSGTNPLLADYTSPDGEESLMPAAGLGDYSQLQEFYKQQTSNNPVVKEDATVVVLNGSDTDGVAHQEATALQNEGFSVSGITDANNVYPNSMIIDQSNGKDPAAKQALEQLFSTDTTTTTSTTTPAEATEAQGYTADFVVVLGQNWDNSQQ